MLWFQHHITYSLTPNNSFPFYPNITLILKSGAKNQISSVFVPKSHPFVVFIKKTYSIITTIQVVSTQLLWYGIKPPVNVRWLIHRALFGNMKWRLIVHTVRWAATSLLVTKRTKTDYLLQEVDFMHSSASALWWLRVNTKSRRKYIDAAERFQGATTVFEVFKDPLLFSKWNLTWAILISPPVFACCDDAATRFSICHQNSYRWHHFCFYSL